MKQSYDATSGTATSSSEGPDVLEVLAQAEALVSSMAHELVPERVPGHRVTSVVAALGRIERKVRGPRLVLRKAAADTGDWRAKGHKSAAEQVAKEEGISVGQAKGELEASARLADQPVAREAAGRGEISPEAAAAVAAGAAADPSAESALVRTAKRGDLRATRRRAQEAITRADERSGQQARRIRERRSLRAWVSIDGEGHGVWNIPAESQARVMAALEPYRKAAFQAARASGERPSEEALLADALDMLARDVLLDHDVDPSAPTAPRHSSASTDAPAAAAPADEPADDASPSLFDLDGADDAQPEDPAPRCGHDGPTPRAVVPTSGRRPSTPAPRNRRAPAQVHVLVDFDALRRRFATDGETCEIHGIGPVPVTLAEHLLQDSLLRLIVTGTDITKVSSQRRYVPDPVRRALFARDHGTCVVPGCGAAKYLELHHFHTDYADGGPTEYGNLAHLCGRHHALATHCGWTLHHTDDGWTFSPPHDDTGKDPP